MTERAFEFLGCLHVKAALPSGVSPNQTAGTLRSRQLHIPERTGVCLPAILRAGVTPYWLFMTALSGFGGNAGSVFSPRSNESA